jgi:MFS family permease
VRPGAHRARHARRTTYTEVFAIGEFRALYSAQVLSVLGDVFARVGIVVLVYARTSSALAAAAAFAIGYLPYVVGGPFLATFAERWPRRQVLIACDLIRAVLLLAVAVPGVPVLALLALLLLTALFDPPFTSTRSALLPDVLPGDRYVTGITVVGVTTQILQLVGFAAGGVVVAVLSPRAALLADAATFVVSALIIRFGTRERPGTALPSVHASVVADTLDGLRYVLSRPLLRAYLLAVWVSAAFVFVPEGLAAAYAAELGRDAVTVGLILAANPVGMILGGIVLGRLLPPRVRITAFRPLALLSTVALIPVAMAPPLPAALGLLLVSGLGISFNLPLNGLFIRALPERYRSRGYAVASGGLLMAQGLGIVVAGAVAEAVTVPLVIGLAGTIGTIAVLLTVLRWPSVEEQLAL